MRRWVFGSVAAFVVLPCVLVFWIFSLFRPVAASGAQPQSFVVEKGENARVIAERLQGLGLIRNATAFAWYVRLQGAEKNIQAGTYSVSPTMSVGDVVNALTKGEIAEREQTITILEGWTNEEIGSYLEAQGLFSKSEWLTVVSVADSRTILPSRTFDRLRDKPSTATLEGYLFPDTYRVFRDAKPADVVEKLLENFETKLTDEIVTKTRSQGKTVFEIVTMASILEREVLTDADKKRASGVFWKRLRDGMALQSDATVNYVTKKGTTRPSLEDIAVDSPYNTYKYPGLPPGPIGNPGLGSIIAALEPEENEYYFFLTTEDGTAVFSKNLEEHNANRQKYLGG